MKILRITLCIVYFGLLAFSIVDFVPKCIDYGYPATEYVGFGLYVAMLTATIVAFLRPAIKILNISAAILNGMGVAFLIFLLTTGPDRNPAVWGMFAICILNLVILISSLRSQVKPADSGENSES
jgi:hypothetical protein